MRSTMQHAQHAAAATAAPRHAPAPRFCDCEVSCLYVQSTYAQESTITAIPYSQIRVGLPFRAQGCVWVAMETRSKLKNLHLEAQCRLWPLGRDMPGPARDAILAALPRPARRCLRTACRAGRAAVDARITSIVLQRADSAPGVAAAVARLPALRHVNFGTAYDPAAADAVAAAVAAFAPSLASLTLGIETPFGIGMGGEAYEGPPIERLAGAMGQCSRLVAVSLEVPDVVHGDLIHLLKTAAPGLTKLALTVTIAASVAPPPTIMDLPWHQLQEVGLDSLAPLLPRLSALPNGLAALRRLKLGRDVSGLDALWAAPWLTQLTRVEVARWGQFYGGDGGSMLTGLPSEGRTLPALQELRLIGDYAADGGFTPADAARLAACRLPALRRLDLMQVSPGALPPLMAAGWAAGLRRLLVDSGLPGWCGAAGAAALARASVLTRLELSCRPSHGSIEDVSLDAAAFKALLTAPWAATLQELSLSGQPLGGGAAGEGAAGALAAAHLPRLRACTLNVARLTAAGVAALAAAPCVAARADGADAEFKPGADRLPGRPGAPQTCGACGRSLFSIAQTVQGPRAMRSAGLVAQRGCGSLST
ncbi:MAG: hypothetical protein J3K34DRAFT_57932 [Monoraphidium minutum]|nr:MAG: hypothetical protein J3K34DRAFT_57932 [Monoraphidium minutum]